VLRLLSMTGFANDHFFYLSRASQLLAGGWPVRDFVDPGFPLAIVASAAAQLIGGRTLLAEATLVAIGFAVSAALTLWVITRWLQSLALALWAVFVQVAVFPLSYSYPKLMMYAVAAVAFYGYARTPTRGRLLALGATTAVAFLFRHDHGVHIGAASAVLIAMVESRAPVAIVVRRLALFAGIALLLVAPYLLYAHAQVGLAEYISEGLHFSSREADRTWSLLPPFGDGPLWSAESLSALGYYVLWATPLAAIAAMRRAQAAPWARQMAMAFVVAALFTDAGFLRDPLVRRVPDAVVPFTLLVCWVAAALWRAPWRSSATAWALRAAAVVVLSVTAAAAAEIGSFAEMVRRTAVVNGPQRMLAHAGTIVGELRMPYTERQMPSDVAFALVPFYRYAQACTPEDARVLVTGFAPEISYYARRGFAGGHPSLYSGYWSSDRDQRRILERMQRETVPFVVASPEGVEQFARAFPLVNAVVTERYVPLADFEVDGQVTPARVFVHRSLTSARTYGSDAWPCLWRP
jgi:hypothetical protein